MGIRCYAERARAFGWHAIEINGHDYEAIDKAFAEAVKTTEQPSFIIAKTEKGHGYPADRQQRRMAWQGFVSREAKEAIEILGGVQNTTIKVQLPEDFKPVSGSKAQASLSTDLSKTNRLLLVKHTAMP